MMTEIRLGNISEKWEKKNNITREQLVSNMTPNYVSFPDTLVSSSLINQETKSLGFL